MARARFEKTIRFRAAHHYRLPDLGDAENRGRFGSLADPHPHDWSVIFGFVGEMEPVTGFSVDLPSVEAAVASVTAGWDGGDLNERIPDVAEGRMLPSCEALARWLFERVGERLGETASLVDVRVAESDEVAAVYPAEPRP